MSRLRLAIIASVSLATVGAMLLTTLPAVPQDPAGSGASRPAPVWTDRFDGDAAALEIEFAGRYPGAWHVGIDPSSGLPNEVYGTGIDLGRPLTSADDVLAASIEFIDDNRDFFGLGTLDLDGEPVLAGSTWYLNFHLVHEGIPFGPRSRFDLRFKDHGVLAAVLTNGIPLAVEPAGHQVSDLDARRVAQTAAATLDARDLRVESDPRLEYVVVGDGTARLAWRLRLDGTTSTRPFSRDYWIAARGSARVLREFDLVHGVDVTGDVKGRGHLFNPTSNLVNLPLAHLEVEVTDTGNKALTDTTGAFTVVNPGSTPVTVAAELRGPWVDVNTVDGSTDLRYEMMHTPGTPVPIRFHTTPPGGSTVEAAQVDGFYHTNVVHDYLQGVLNFAPLDTPIPCNVNDNNSTCNAFYTAGTINFFAEGGNCRNMAFDTIIYHEYGHFLDDVAGGIIDRALTEGLADVVAVLTSGQPLIGEDYKVTAPFLRTADNDRVWPAIECGSTPQCIGETFLGFVWHARERLIRALGQAQGIAHAEQIVLRSVHGNAINIPRAVLEVFIQDDDDGNLGNRTPNYGPLARAALRHGFDPPGVQAIGFTHTEMPFATVDSINPLPLAATIVPQVGPLTTRVLHYSIDDSSTFQSVNMAPGTGPDEWTAEIPRQPCGTWIKYYFEAVDAIGNRRTAPPLAPGPLRREVFSFHIGRAETIFFDDFESGIGNWTHGADAGEDDWEVGPPNPTGTHPYDPPAAYSGTGVAGNDLSMDGNYSDNSSNFLTTTVDCTNFSTVWAKFRYYASAERGSSDTLRFRIENSTPFTNDQRQGLATTVWYSFERDVSRQAGGNAEADFQFTLSSNDSINAGGWNIDDFDVRSVTCDTVTLELSETKVGLGDSVVVTLQGAPNEPYYFFSDHKFGNATFQVPGGPIVATGLTQNQKLRVTHSLDSSGQRQFTRNFPANPALIGKQYIFVVVSKNNVWQRSNFFQISIQP